jgi:hypothetical protein
MTGRTIAQGFIADLSQLFKFVTTGITLKFINWHGYPSNGPEGANYTAITRSRELLCEQGKKYLDPVAPIKAIIYKCTLN